jgi:hypothetical protein
LPDPIGTWTELVDMAMVYDSPEACTADQGVWKVDEGCMFKATNSVVFGAKSTVDGVDVWPVKVETFGGNAHTCNLDGLAKAKGDHLLATVSSEAFEGDEPSPQNCNVTFRFGANGLDVDAQDVACQFFCGVRAQIYIRGAKK